MSFKIKRYICKSCGVPCRLETDGDIPKQCPYGSVFQKYVSWEVYVILRRGVE